MATFLYKAAKSSGATFGGQIDGDDERAVRNTLESDGYIVIQLHAQDKNGNVRTGKFGFVRKLPLHV